MRFRDGKSTINDWQTLLQRTPAQASNVHEFTDAAYLYYKKDNVAQYNYEAIIKLGTPIARINVLHSCATVAGDLEPVVFIMTKGAKVIDANK